jgi:hypothetical protein
MTTKKKKFHWNMFIYILYSLLLETNFLFWTSSGCKHTPVPNPSPIQQKMGKIESPWPEKCQREAIKSILQTAWPLAKGDEEILRCWANLWIKETRSKGKYGNVMTLNTHSKHNTHQLQYPPFSGSHWLEGKGRSQLKENLWKRRNELQLCPEV